MQQDVVMDAGHMASGLSANGSAAIYGIQFDTGKSDLKPESESTLSEMAKLLKQTRSSVAHQVGGVAEDA